MPPAKPHQEGEIYRDDFWGALGLEDVRMLDIYAKEGNLVRANKRGYFLFLPSIKKLVSHLREVAAGRASKDGKYDVAAESAQLKAAQRRLTELKIKAAEGDLVSAAEVLELWGELVKDVRSMMLSLPARVQGELPHMVPSEMETIKRVARTMLSELKALGETPPKPRSPT